LPKIAAVGDMRKFLFLILFISAFGFLFYFSIQEAWAADVIVQSQVANGNDDAWEDYDNALGGGYGSMYVTSSEIRLKYYTFPEPDEAYLGGFRWVFSSPIPKDATINTAYASFYIFSTTYDDAKVELSFQDSSNPPTFQAVAYDISDRSVTSANVDWDDGSLGTGWKDTPSLVIPLQELVNKYDISALVLLTDQYVNSQWELRITSYNGNPTYAARLYVNYTPPAPPATLPAVTTDIATVDLSTNQATLNGTVTNTGGENCDKRGFVYGATSISTNPGNVAPGSSGYSNYVEDSGSYGTGSFTKVQSLTVGSVMYYRVYAHNSAGYSYGEEKRVVAYQESGSEESFSISIIIDQLCDPKEDFTGECQSLVLYGDQSYLNVKWDAHYKDNVEREIGVECYLNCPSPSDDIKTNCAAYENLTNYCSYKSLTGYGFCTIVDPGYLFKGQINNVTCSFYDPSNPDIQYSPYPNRTFKPIDFDVYSVFGGSLTVGEPFVLPANVRNFGLFAGNFTSNISALVKPHLIYIENPITMIENLKYNDIVEIYSKVTFLSAEKINLKVLVKSNLDRTTCSGSGDCGYLGSGAECIGSACWKRTTVEINPRMSSLPEFNWTGLLQIIIISTVVVFFSKRKS